MRKVVSMFVVLFMYAFVFAQTPQKISYQAVIRDASGNLVVSTTVGIRISILQGTSNPSVVYMETHSPKSNANGLVSLEIGSGAVGNGDFSTINWGNGTYYVKTETDITGGTNYTVTGTSQLLSVPFALHAKTAETFTGTITETDPYFKSSLANGITASDTIKWNRKLNNETDPEFNSSIAKGITASDTINWNKKLDNYTETDPNYSSSIASGITASDTVKWNNKLESYTETDPVFSSAAASGIKASDTIKWNQKLDNSVFTTSVAGGITATDTANWNKKLGTFTETDPLFKASISGGITASDTIKWNKKQNKLTAGTGIDIVGNTISIISNNDNNYYLGQEALGGIIFYIYIGSDGNQHGLVVSTTEGYDQWQTVGSSTTGRRSWDGKYNTNLMINSPAKSFCQGLTNGGYSDWYLPSLDELRLLFEARFHVNATLFAKSYTMLTENIYWSSTERAAASAYYYYAATGYITTGTKTDAYFIRAVRAF